MESAFSYIYANHIWGVNLDNRPSSGPGSRSDLARPFMEFIQTFFQENKVKSIVDVGCGDFQYMRNIDLTNYSYLGFDCVKDVVEYNNKRFGRTNIRFEHNDCSNPESLPKADVYIAKDVLQHWNNDSIRKFLDFIFENKICKYIIIANCYQQKYDNQEVKCIGDTRFLNANMKPLSDYKAHVIKTYGTKQISVITVY